MAISLSMALPALGGYWLDARLGTGFVFVVIGALLGFALGMVQLMQIAKATSSPPKGKVSRGDGGRQEPSD